MKTKYVLLSILIGLAILMAGCSIEPAESTPNVAGTAAAMAETIVAVQLTKVAENATATPTTEPTATATFTPTISIPTVFPTQSSSSGDNGTCLLASMISETIPDGTVLEPGEIFDKAWVIQNKGTCTWTNEYKMIYHHGDTLGADAIYSFGGAVAPGESFTLTVPMMAPAVAGEYTSFWTLQSPDGKTFGTNSSALFWARVVVEDVMPPDSLFDLWVPVSSANVNTVGVVNSNLMAGDTQHDYSVQGFVTFNLNKIPANATITAVSMLFEGKNIVGDPFGSLGCLGVYRYSYGSIDSTDFFTSTPGGALWSYCSSGEISGNARYGGDTAIANVQNSIGGNIQFRFQYNTDTDNDSAADTITLFPVLRIEYTVP